MMENYKKIELEHELNHLRSQKKNLLLATSYNNTRECQKAISDLLQYTNEEISKVNKELQDLMDKES